MKYLFSFLLIGSIVSVSMAQKPTRFISVSGEINFSSAKIIDEEGNEGGEITRFAPWFNLQIYNNIDRETSGMFYGLTIRNIGFIYERGSEKWKARNYVLGIPIGLKWGDMDGRFVYGGYEFEVPIHYRERYYLNDSRKNVVESWFDDRVQPYTHAAFIGFNFRYGFNLKFKYYFTEFFNRDYDKEILDPQQLFYSGGVTDPNTGEEIPARSRLQVNIYYVAVTWNMFRKPYYYREYEKKKETEEIY